MTSPTPSPITDQAAGEREAFETWVRKELPALELKWLPTITAYAGDQAEWLWTTWQARAALSTAPTTGSAPDCKKCGRPGRFGPYEGCGVCSGTECRIPASPVASVLPAIRDALNVAYAEGWAVSGEGYNYEYPGRNFNSVNWEAKRDLAIDHLVNRIAASMGGDKS